MRNLFRNEKADAELAREVASHLAFLADEFERRGRAPEHPRVAAKRAYGGVEQAKQPRRQVRFIAWLTG
jgi:hypothetical protein